MEEQVALVHGVSARGQRRDGAVVLEVRYVEEVFGGQPLVPTERYVRAHVVQITEAGGEGDMAGVVQRCAAEDENAVL